MIIRRSTLEQIGLLDEGLYTYFDDVDMCLRARRAGWETWYVVESEVIHLGGASTGVTARAAECRPDYWFEAQTTVLSEELREGVHCPGGCCLHHRILAGGA